jgi:hypothetical protein
MRWILRGAAALAVAWLLFLASPFVALHNFARAVEARDTAAVAERVNFRALRFSLMKQVVNAYAQETGAGRALGASERQLAVEAGMGLAAPVVEALLTPQAVIDLLNGVAPAAPEDTAPPSENTETPAGEPVGAVQHLQVRSLGAAWHLIRKELARKLAVPRRQGRAAPRERAWEGAADAAPPLMESPSATRCA